MTFGFEFKLPGLIYYVMGYVKEEDARLNLEEISMEI